jgi:hypothetical protein
MVIKIINLLKPLTSPIIFIEFLKSIKNLFPASDISLSFWKKTNVNFKKLNTYYIRNEHLWLDGFLFDFLQKKTADI